MRFAAELFSGSEMCFCVRFWCSISKNLFQFVDAVLHDFPFLIFEDIFKSAVVFINVFQTFKMKSKIPAIKRTVYKTIQPFKSFFFMRHHKIIRCVAHQFHHSLRIFDDHFAIPQAIVALKKPGISMSSFCENKCGICIGSLPIEIGVIVETKFFHRGRI